MPTFEELKAECLKKDVLFQDPDFPANDSVLASADRNRQITWQRPREIVYRPMFILEATYYDIHQGSVDDSYFLSSVNALMANDKELLEKVMPRDQGFGRGYAGIFRFNFWQFGDWKEIYVDDRLPLNYTELIYSRNQNRYEFWVCLLEKAYAKLRGTYEDLNFGFTTNVLVDLTGGLSEFIMLKRTELNLEELFNMMCKMWKMNTLIVVTIYGKEVKVRSNGLVESHSYAMTSIAKVPFGGKMEQLIRLRNPFGYKEWNGPWSDRSEEWRQFSDEDKQKYGVSINEEGEFWIRLADIKKEVDEIGFCHKEKSAFTDIVTDPDAEKAEWSSHVFKDLWVKDVSSGGNDSTKDIYWRNPQYIMDLSQLTDNTWVVISLMKVVQGNPKKDTLDIGFNIHKVKSGLTVPRSGRVDSDTLQFHSSYAMSPEREHSKSFELPPGTYVLIVYNGERITRDYLLRIYSESTIIVREATTP